MRERDDVGTYDDIVAAAVRTTGLDDFGDDTHEEGLRVLLEDYAGPAGLTGAGNARMRAGVKGLLVAKLLSQQGFADHPEAADVVVERPIFITGLPRSGTTLLQRLLTADPAHQGLEQWLADLPQPRPPRESWADHPIFAAMQAGYATFHEQNPELAGIHYSDATTHEECWRLLQQAGRSIAFETQAHVPTYSAWLREQTWDPAYARHRRLLQLIGSTSPERRWVLKNPSHLIAADALLRVYPDALILVTHRDPVTCTASMCSLAEASTRGLSETFVGEAIGRTQLDLLRRETEAFAAARPGIPSDRIIDVDYDDLTGDPLGTLGDIYTRFELGWSDRTQAAVSAELDASRQGPRAPKHDYDLADYGLTEAMVRTTLTDLRPGR